MTPVVQLDHTAQIWPFLSTAYVVRYTAHWHRIKHGWIY